jgi:hypothetical protein
MSYQKYFINFHKSIESSIEFKENLMTKINNIFECNYDRKQLIRVIDYLTVWQSLNMNNGKQLSIQAGFVDLAAEYFTPQKESENSNIYEYDDLGALIKFLNKIINRFIIIDSLESKLLNLASTKSYISEKDIFSSMTNFEMDEFNQKICELYNILTAVYQENNKLRGCEFLKEVFGKNFHISSKIA